MKRNSKKGITLVELIVALTLTSIFAVLCVALINPIERTYRGTLKMARAQLLADTIVDSIRKECDDVKHDEKMSVWIGNLGSADDYDLLDKGPGIKITGGSGDILVFQRNSNYTEAIYSNAKISDTNFTNVENNPLTPSNTVHSISALDNDAKEANLKKGIVHFGYYQAKEDDRGIFPIKSYDYTNPVLASTYGNFTVDLKFENLTFSKSDKYPVYVLCKVNVLEKGTTVYTRSAVICFAANGSGNGSYTPTTAPKKKDIDIKIVWDDHKNYANRPADGVTIELWNASKTILLGTHVVSDVKTEKPQKFTFKDIDTSDGFSVTQTFNSTAPGYQTKITKKANSAVITNKGSAVTLLAGTDLNALLHKNDVLHVVFGMESAIRSRVALPSSYSKASIAGNNLTEDYKLYWVSSSKTIYIVSDDGRFIANPDCSQMFEDCKKLVSITWNDGAGDFVIDTSNTTNMASMFKHCEQITQFNLKNLVQNQCASIAGMFEGCTHGSQLNNISTWDTSAVKNMSRMFYNYGIYHNDESDGSIDISNFDFSSCETMMQMFMNDKNDEKAVAEIKFPASTPGNLLNMNKVTSMEQLFYSNARLKKITNFNCMNCQNLTNVNKMFDYCEDLTILNLQHFKMPKCDIEDQYVQGKQYHAFWGCNNLKEINLDGWDISSETDLRDFFGYLEKLEKASLRDCKTPKLKSAEGLFFHCHSLKEVYLPGFVGESCTTIRSIFNECWALETMDISEWKTGNIKYMRDAFTKVNLNCPTALKLDLSLWEFGSVIDITQFCYSTGFSEIKFKSHSAGDPLDFNKVTSIRMMFADNSRLTKIENFDNASFASYIKSYEKKSDEHGTQQKEYGSEKVFMNCSKLTSIDISGLKLPNCESVKEWFYGCSSITSVIMDNDDLRNATNYTSLFTNCSNLTSIKMNSAFLNSATKIEFVLSTIKNLEFNKANLSGLKSLSSLFSGKYALEHVDFSDVTLGNITSAASMFKDCKGLKKLEMRGFTAPASCKEMFMNCVSLSKCDLSGWDTKATTDMSFMFCHATTKNGAYEPELIDGIDKFVLDISSFNFNKVTAMNYFMGIKENQNYSDRLNRVIFPAGEDGNASLVTNSERLFRWRTQVTDIENFEYYVLSSQCNDISGMFSRVGCTEVDIRGIHAAASANKNFMFDNCANLTTIYVAPDADFSSAGKDQDMFKESKKIVGGSGTVYNASNVGRGYAKIDGGPSSPGYFTDFNQKPAPEADP